MHAIKQEPPKDPINPLNKRPAWGLPASGNAGPSHRLLEKSPAGYCPARAGTPAKGSGLRTHGLRPSVLNLRVWGPKP